MKDDKAVIGITIGDINGISFEVILKSLMDQRMLNYCTPVLYASNQITNYHRKTLNIHDVNFHLARSTDQIRKGQFNLVQAWNQEPKVELGKATTVSGEYALYSLNQAVNDLKENKLDAIVTSPINKKTVQSEKFNFPGHTEFFKQIFNAEEVLMLMIGEELKVGVATGHISLKEVSETLSKDLIVNKLRVFEHSLKQDFGINKAKIAVLGLNPHAGEEGLLGKEEEEMIIPAIEQAKENEILAIGPFAADGFFGTQHFRKFDGVLAMYHDQGLAPFKVLAFNNGVNYTAGLPIVRTSPDHGTGYAIAGNNQASENSFRNAIFLAIDILKERKNHREINSNPLESRMIKEKESH